MSLPTVVIGGDADALVAAHLLARNGEQVVLLADAAASSADTGWVPAQVQKLLRLQRLEMQHDDPWTADGAGLELSRDMAKTVAAIKHRSPQDAERWPEFCARMAHVAAFLEDLYLAPAPEPTSLGFALRLRRLGRRGMQDVLRLLPMPVADLLDDWFECDSLKGLLGAAAVRSLRQGPRSAGTAFTLLHQQAGSPAGVFRAPRCNLSGLLLSAKGITVRRAKAGRIAVRGGRAHAVMLEGGEEIAVSRVVSGLEPRRTLLELVDPGWLDPELARAIGNIRTRGAAARLRIRLDRAASFSTLTVAPSLDYVERAYDHVKYGRVSKDPVLEVHALGDALDVHLQFVPGDFHDAEALGKRVLEMLRERLDGAGVIDVKVDLPAALPQHAELALDQVLWMRPVPELARGRTPIEGLWLCGPDMHPGPGVLGASAYHCVEEMASA